MAGHQHCKTRLTSWKWPRTPLNHRGRRVGDEVSNGGSKGLGTTGDRAHAPKALEADRQCRWGTVRIRSTPGSGHRDACSQKRGRLGACRCLPPQRQAGRVPSADGRARCHRATRRLLSAPALRGAVAVVNKDRGPIRAGGRNPHVRADGSGSSKRHRAVYIDEAGSSRHRRAAPGLVVAAIGCGFPRNSQKRNVGLIAPFPHVGIGSEAKTVTDARGLARRPARKAGPTEPPPKTAKPAQLGGATATSPRRCSVASFTPATSQGGSRGASATTRKAIYAMVRRGFHSRPRRSKRVLFTIATSCYAGSTKDERHRRGARR